jgi:hypothetical protein
MKFYKNINKTAIKLKRWVNIFIADRLWGFKAKKGYVPKHYGISFARHNNKEILYC